MDQVKSGEGRSGPLVVLDRLGLADGEDQALTDSSDVAPGKDHLQADLLSCDGKKVAGVQH